MKALSRTLLFCLGIALVGAPSVGAALTPLDNFNGKSINPQTWWGYVSNGSTNPVEELFRGTVPNSFTGVGRLLGLSLVSYGNTLSDIGRPFQQQGLRVQVPGVITTLQASVVIHTATAQPCLDNPTSSRARARLDAALFNSVSAVKSGTGDQTGDVQAVIQKVLDSGTGALPTATHIIEAFLQLCNNADCGNNTVLPNSVVFTKKWAFDVSQKLTWEWDDAQSQVVFTVGTPGSPNAETHAVPYSQVNMGGPGFDFKGIGVATSGASCTAGRRRATIEAGFDNVFTNP